MLSELREVKRHELGRSDTAKMSEESGQAVVMLADTVVVAPAGAIQMQALLSGIWTSFCLGGDPRAQQDGTLRAAAAAARAWLAMFELASVDPNTPMTLDLGVCSFETTGTGWTQDTHLNSWLPAYWWAQVSRLPGAVDLLCRFDLEYLTTTGQFDEYRLCKYRALRGFDEGDPAWPSEISAAMASIDKPVIASREESMYLALDLFGLLAAIGGEQAEFDEQLERALTSHRRYWSATEERRQDPRGFFSLPILALAAKALDHGMSINVESDYLPQGLLLNPSWLTGR